MTDKSANPFQTVFFLFCFVSDFEDVLIILPLEFYCHIFQAMFSERTGVEMNPPTQRCGLILLFLYTRPKREEKNHKPFIKKESGIHTHQRRELA